MKYEWETEEQFLQRVKEARKRGQCVFRDDANMDFILDIIDFTLSNDKVSEGYNVIPG